MNVTIMGTGNMGRGIATRLLACGHRVTLLDREAGNSGALARELGGSVDAGTVGDPIAGEAVVLAVPYEAAAPLVRQYGETLSGKVVVDIINPVDWQTFDGLVTPPTARRQRRSRRGHPRGRGSSRPSTPPSPERLSRERSRASRRMSTWPAMTPRPRRWSRSWCATVGSWR